MARNGQLTAKQTLFCQEYLVDLNASAACLRAGYATKNPDAVGAQLLAKPHVAGVVAVSMAKRAKRTEITADRVLKELARLGFVNMADFVTMDGSETPVLDFSRVTREQMAAVSEITQDTYLDGKGEDAKVVKRTKIKLYDKNTALSQLAKNLGITPETLNIKAEGAFKVIIHRGAQSRLKK